MTIELLQDVPVLLRPKADSTKEISTVCNAAGSVWAISEPTFIESWPGVLHSLSIRSIGVPLSTEEAQTLGRSIIDWGETFETFPQNCIEVRDALIRKLDSALRAFPLGAFVKLGSRSPKDALNWSSSHNVVNGQIKKGRDAFGTLTACSERISDDLHFQLMNDYQPWIWLREGLDLPKWSEFRCFMKDRELVGISQYFAREWFEEIAAHVEEIKQAIKAFFFEQFRSASHLDSVVFDIFVRRRQDHTLEVRLLEINPFCILTDPCLFQWNELERNSSEFRYSRATFMTYGEKI